MAKHPMRRHRDDGRPTEPAVTFQFRNVEHYQEWMHGKGIQKLPREGPLSLGKRSLVRNMCVIDETHGS